MDSTHNSNELQFIKKHLLTELKFEHIAPANSPTFLLLEEFKQLMVETRKNIAHSSNNQDISEHLEKLRVSFIEAWQPENSKPEANSLRKAMQNFYFDSGVAGPKEKLESISEAFKNEETSSFAITCKNLFAAISMQKVRKHFSSMSPDELLTINAPLSLQPNYEEIKTRASKIAERFELSSITTDNEIKSTKKLSKFLDSLEVALEDGAKQFGMDEKCFGKQGMLSYECNLPSKKFSGLFYQTKNIISLSPNLQSSFTSTTIHEWIHAVDHNVALDLHNYLSAKKSIIPSDLNKFSFTSTVDTPLELDSSKEATAYKVLREFTANVITSDIDELKKFQREEQIKISTHFWHEALGASFYSISDTQKEILNDVDTYQHIRNKILNPQEQEYGKNILDILIKCAPELVNQHVEFYTVQQTQSPLLDTAKKDIQKIEDFKSVGINTYIRNSITSDKFQDDINKCLRIFNLNDQQTSKETYYQSNLEALARYVESQLNPKKAQFVNANQATTQSRIYPDNIDPNFDKQRKALISAVFGEQAVREIKPIKEHMVVTAFMKATGIFFETIGTLLVAPVKIVSTLQDIKVATIQSNSGLNGEILKDGLKNLSLSLAQPVQDMISDTFKINKIQDIISLKFNQNFKDSEKNNNDDIKISEIAVASRKIQ